VSAHRAKCGTEHRVGRWKVGRVELPLCVWCHEDTQGLQAWLAEQMEAAMKERGYVRREDGTWDDRP
jgi:hypothetical protein